MSLERDLVVEALPSYEIGDELGRGGWGIVLEGRHHQLGRGVAIKQLPRAFAADPDVRSRFLAEGRLLASLDHPHIVPVYDFVERDGLCLLVMEKLPGGTVWTQFVDNGVLPDAACAIGVAAAVALHHAHERGILHRDVKPENLMFSAAGIMKVTDFGIAKVLSGGKTMATRAGDVLGTPAYMSPEQALGNELGPGTDIYALGVMLYELLSGRLPFPESGESPLAVLYQHVNDAPVDLAVASPGVARPVADVVMRALSKSPSDRYATAEEFGVALAEAATKSFGAGWVRRGGFTLMTGGRVLAATEQGVASDFVPRSHATLRPDDLRDDSVARLKGGGAIAPEDFVPIAELPDAPTSTSLRDLGAALSRAATPEAQRFAADIERLESGAHEVRELRLLQRHRTGPSPFRQADWAEVERLLGAYGTAPAERLGLDPSASDDQIRSALSATLDRWQRRAESPLSSSALSAAARTLVRTCEGMLLQLDDDV